MVTAATADSLDLTDSDDCGLEGLRTLASARKLQKKAARAIQHHKFVRTLAKNRQMRTELSTLRRLQSQSTRVEPTLEERVDAQRQSLRLHADDVASVGYPIHYAATAAVVATPPDQPRVRNFKLEVQACRILQARLQSRCQPRRRRGFKASAGTSTYRHRIRPYDVSHR